MYFKIKESRNFLNHFKLLVKTFELLDSAHSTLSEFVIHICLSVWFKLYSRNNFEQILNTEVSICSESLKITVKITNSFILLSKKTILPIEKIKVKKV